MEPQWPAIGFKLAAQSAPVDPGPSDRGQKRKAEEMEALEMDEPVKAAKTEGATDVLAADPEVGARLQVYFG